MTEEDKELIAGYMGWDIVTVGPKKRPYKIYVDSKDCNIHHEFDLNDAGLCVQEMQKRGEFAPFYDDLLDTYNGLCEDGKATCGADNFTAWLFNPENFFGAMAAWIKEGI